MIAAPWESVLEDELALRMTTLLAASRSAPRFGFQPPELFLTMPRSPNEAQQRRTT
jgi:hypothetical protein